MAAAIMALGSGVGFAQSDTDTKQLALEEVVVTAQRREESLQDVPISVSAFTSESIEKANITSASDYLAVTPNVAFSEDGEGGSRSINISIRGVSNITLDGISTANSIGYYIDELSVGSVAQGTINPQLQDVERIEVLRGPQGTYFGRNAVGGALNITTKKPDDQFLFEGSVKAGNFGSKGAETVINVPISDKLMARAVLGYDESDTPIKNVNPLGNDPFYEYTTGRVSIRALPTDDITLDLSVTHTQEDEGGDISIPSGVVDLDTQSIFGIGAHDAVDSGQGFYPENKTRIDRDTRELNEKEFTVVNARLTWELENMTFKSITGWLDSSFDRVADLDGIPFTFGPLPLRRVNDYAGDSISQEFRLQSAGEDTVDWTAGLYYVKDELDRNNQIQILPKDDPNAAVPLGFINSNIQEFDYESSAVFGEMVWHLNDQFDLTLGGRYSRDKVTASEIDLVARPVPVKDTVEFSDFSPRVVLRYIPTDDLTLYGSVSKGYKAGGTDVTGGSRTEGAEFDPEELINYELGFKSSLLDGRVNLSGAIFALRWDDFQVQTSRLEDPTDIGSDISTTQNANEASAEGIELEMLALLTEGLTWSVGLGYIDAQFDDYQDAVLKGETNGLPNVVDVSGQPLPRTPEWTFNTALEYRFNVGGMDPYVRAQWAYTDETVSDIEGVGSLVGQTVNGDPFNLPEFPYQIDSYDVLNLSAGLETDSYRVSAFVKNALDEDYYTGTADNFGAAGIRLRPHYREFGVKFTYIYF
ncbi:TonB-dependent receptor [Microbulbifer sp. TYP-18]|uniref:TonB-dependent receptor n=1 Tax=Microbulbifer sp. TYP-18 TaxID=3230024 RepID=UPI0034C5D078